MHSHFPEHIDHEFDYQPTAEMGLIGEGEEHYRIINTFWPVQVNPLSIEPRAECTSADAWAVKIMVPDDYATLPEAVAAATEKWREIRGSGDDVDIRDVPCIVLRPGDHGWQGTLQIKPGMVLHIEGEEKARVRGHWWMHAGSGGVIRGVECVSEGNHVMTAYGGCWLIEDCELRCGAGSGACISLCFCYVVRLCVKILMCSCELDQARAVLCAFAMVYDLWQDTSYFDASQIGYKSVSCSPVPFLLTISIHAKRSLS